MFDPAPRRFDGGPLGSELPQLDRHWRIGQPMPGGRLMYHIGTPHQFILKDEDVHHFDEDPTRGDGFGILHLNKQLNIGGDHVWMTVLTPRRISVQ